MKRREWFKLFRVRPNAFLLWLGIIRALAAAGEQGELLVCKEQQSKQNI
jgi:hypothetical protein